MAQDDHTANDTSTARADTPTESNAKPKPEIVIVSSRHLGPSSSFSINMFVRSAVPSPACSPARP